MARALWPRAVAYAAIQQRAYEIYLWRGRVHQPGTAAEDWAQALRELEGR